MARQNKLIKNHRSAWLLLGLSLVPLLSGCPRSGPAPNSSPPTGNAAPGGNAASVRATSRPFVIEPTPQTIQAEDVSQAAFPKQPASGSLRGAPFKVDRVLLQASSSPLGPQGHTSEITQYSLTFHTGQTLRDLREVVVHLNMQSGTKLPRQLITAQPAALGTPAWQHQHSSNGPAGVPLGVVGVHLTWVNKGQPVPQSWYISDKFSLRLQFGQPQKGGLPGQIILRLPDKEKSWVGGAFVLSAEPQDPEPAWNGPPPNVAVPDVSHAALPAQGVAGNIYGQPFQVDKVIMESNGVLTFSQGKNSIPDRDIKIFLFLKTDEKLDGKTYQIKPHTPSGTLIPHLFLEWVANPSAVPRVQKQVQIMDKYSMNLRFGTAKNGFVPGQIVLRLPDARHSFIRGSFNTQLPPQR